MVGIRIEFTPNGSPFPYIANQDEALPDGLVYMCQSGRSNYVKIGMSHRAKLPHRLTTLQAGNPEELRLLCVCVTSSPRRLEAHLQRHFAPYQHRREWFALPDAVIAVFTSEEGPDGR
jgi:hypothetical protein